VHQYWIEKKLYIPHSHFKHIRLQSASTSKLTINLHDVRKMGTASHRQVQPTRHHRCSTSNFLKKNTAQSEVSPNPNSKTSQIEGVRALPLRYTQPVPNQPPLGGRTAWSTITTINGIPYPARFWYDGEYVAQAKEDSAEIALRTLTGTMNLNTEPPPASYYAPRAQV
jgi:hypothetical protein